jgi:undecaprenyl-diphosphatase
VANVSRKNYLNVLKALKSSHTEFALKKTIRPILLLSAFMLIFGLIIFAGSYHPSYATAAVSGGEAHNVAFLASNHIPLNISISSPENKTYTVSNVPLTFNVNASISWAGYSLDGQSNVTIPGNTTLTNLAEGSHFVVVYANDTTGALGSSQTVYFTVGQVSILEIVPLGIIQGLTEWLPVSSTAHLKIAQHLMNLEVTPLLNVTLHLGTLIVVVFYFRKDVKDILSALAHLDFKSESGQLIPLIVVATVPTGIIGIIYAEFLENSFQTLLIIGITFLVGATWLYTSRIGKENVEFITLSTAFIMGAAQGLASFPGLSRSGITISTALLLGLKREEAFRFSFLLSIPAIIGDTAYEAYHNRGQFAVQNISPLALFVGIALAAVTGYVAIRVVSNLVRSKRFHYFAFYTSILGITLVVLTLTI